MRKTLKYYARFMSLIMLMTSCYSYQKVPSNELSNKEMIHYGSIELGDKVKIVTDMQEFKRVWIHSFTDTTLAIRYDKKGDKIQLEDIELSDINKLYIYEKDPKKTKILVGVPVALAIYLFFVIMMVSNMNMSPGWNGGI